MRKCIPVYKLSLLTWIAVTLNVVPGLGAGYLHQRRWKAYWITSALATTWLVLGQGADECMGARTLT